MIFVANCDPRILKCDTIQSYVCNRKKEATHVLIPMGLSLAVTISVCIYFVRKVYCLSKVHPMPTSVTQVDSTEENVVRRINQNPNQFFRVKISKALERFPSSQETYPMLSMAKKALIVNLVSLCQMAFLIPLCVIDILLMLQIHPCDAKIFVILVKCLGAFGLFWNICFPICLEKKLDKFCFH